MIRFDRVAKRYPSGREALADVSLEVQAGEMVFLTGHSGAGKSTVLKLIALIERATRGQVLVAGQNLAQVPHRGVAWYRRQIGMVFQDHKLLHDRPIWDNVALPLVIAGVPRREADKRVRAALDQVGLLGRETSFPIELSTGNLDPDLSLEVMRLFKRFNDVGVTVVIASHDLNLIEQLGCRRVVLQSGRTVEGSADGMHAAGGATGSTGASSGAGAGPVTGTATIAGAASAGVPVTGQLFGSAAPSPRPGGPRG